MAAAQFTVGEHVRVRTASPVVGAGTVGTIQLVDRSVGDLYEVQFDGYARPRLMRARELERADDTHPPDRQSTPDEDVAWIHTISDIDQVVRDAGFLV
jgi:hypothetical protein